MRCAERARLVVVLRGRSAATHVAAIRKRPRRHEWVAFLTMSFVFMVSEVRAPVMGTDARKTLDQFSTRANASRSSRGCAQSQPALGSSPNAVRQTDAARPRQENSATALND